MKKAAPFIFLVVLAILVLVVKQCKKSSTNRKEENRPTHTEKEVRGLNRTASVLLYAPLATCQMQCYNISKQDVMDLLKGGKINYAKSNVHLPDCQKEYVVEGYTNDKNTQHLRILFIPCKQNQVTVAACTSYDVTDVDCNCK